MMKLQSKSSKELRAALQMSSLCIAPKNTLAILENVLLSYKDNQFFFTSSTNDSELTITAPLTLLSGKFEKSLALPVSGLISYLSTLPDCVLNLEFDNAKLLVDYCTGSDESVKSGNVSLNYFGGEEFPLMVGVGEHDKTTIVLPNGLLMTAVKQAQTFAANDEFRPVMNTLCIDIAEDMSECHLVATNGHSLMRYIHTNNPATGGSNFYREGSPKKILINRTFFKTLSAFQGHDDVEITSDGNMIRMKAGDIVYVCKEVEGRFPDYDSVIPMYNPHFICFDKKEMLDSIKRVSLFGSDSQMVRIKKQGMFLSIKAEDLDFSTSADDQVIISKQECSDNFEIGFKAPTLVNCISAIESDCVRIQLCDPTKSGVLTADEPTPMILTLCMPMLLS